MFEEFNIKQKDKYFLLIITIFSTLLIAYYINFNNIVGISCSDVYVYLLNSQYYAGIPTRHIENIYISPVFCYLTSLLFRIGLMDKLAIFIVSGIFAIIGNIGLYLLFRKYFDEILSLTGVIIFSSSTLFLTWLGNGTLDIPGVCMIIWSVLFLIIAVKENPKFYPIFFTVFTVGVFTRYTLLLISPALILFYVYENGFKIKRDEVKYILIGVLIAIILTNGIMHVLTDMGSEGFGVSGQISGGISGTQGHLTDPAHNTDYTYYLKNLPNFISNSDTVFRGNPVLENPTILSWSIIAILIIGAGIWLYDNKPKVTKRDIIPIVLFIISIATFSHVSSSISTVLVFIGLYLLGRKSENKTGFFMLALILSNLIYLSYFDIKVNRYILPIFPSLTFFILTAIKNINYHIKINKNIIPIVLIGLFIIQAFAFTATFEPTNQYNSTEVMSDYLASIDPNYTDVPIATYNIRPFLWWIGDNAEGIPRTDVNAIKNSNVTYYISNAKIDNLTNYTEIKHIDPLYLYKKGNNSNLTSF